MRAMKGGREEESEAESYPMNWLRLSEGLIGGIHHALNNRMGALSGAAQVLEAPGLARCVRGPNQDPTREMGEGHTRYRSQTPYLVRGGGAPARAPKGKEVTEGNLGFPLYRDVSRSGAGYGGKPWFPSVS